MLRIGELTHLSDRHSQAIEGFPVCRLQFTCFMLDIVYHKTSINVTMCFLAFSAILPSTQDDILARKFYFVKPAA